MYKCFIAFILLLVSSLSFAEFDPFADDGSSPPRDPVQYQIDLEKANRAAERAMREEQESAPVPAPPTAARPQPRVLEPVTPSAPPVSRARPATSSSSSKNRTEYGMYGNWDAYKLNLADRQQCSVRQVYDDGSKVIVTQELAADGKHLWLYLQDKGSSFPPNYAGTVKVRIIGSGTVLYAEEAAVQNTTGNTVEMVRVTIEDWRFLSVLKLGMVMEVHWLDGSKIADRYRFGTGLPQALAAVNDQCVPTLALTQKQLSSGNGESSGSSRSDTAANADWKPPQWWVDLKAWAAKNQAEAGNTNAPVKDAAKAKPAEQQKPSDDNTGGSYNGLIILGVLVGIFMLGTMLLPKGSSSEDSSGVEPVIRPNTQKVLAPSGNLTTKNTPKAGRRFSRQEWGKICRALPQDLQNSLDSTDDVDFYVDLKDRYGLTWSQVGDLGSEAGWVLAGITPIGEFASNLEGRLNIQRDVALSIAKEVTQKVFRPVRRTLKIHTGMSRECYEQFFGEHWDSQWERDEIVKEDGDEYLAIWHEVDYKGNIVKTHERVFRTYGEDFHSALSLNEPSCSYNNTTIRLHQSNKV